MAFQALHRGGPLDTFGSFDNQIVGRIAARDALLTFESGLLLSGGQLAIGTGATDVFGRVEVGQSLDGSGNPGRLGQVIVSGTGSVTFWDDFRNNGEVRVSAGSVATFFGRVDGAGSYTGTGAKFFEGGFAPGNSPALVQMTGPVTFGEASPLEIQIGGLLAGLEHDKVVVDGDLTLLGGLQVSWLPGGFETQVKAGDSFDLLDWTTLEGSFSYVSLPGLNPTLLWDTSDLYVTGELHVVAVPEPGSVALVLAGLGLVGLRARRRGRG